MQKQHDWFKVFLNLTCFTPYNNFHKLQRKKMLNIGIDIDGVLTDYEGYIKSIFNTHLKKRFPNEVINMEHYDRHGISKNAYNYIWDILIWEYAKYPARIQASEIMHKLKKEGHNLIICTNRWATDFDNEEGQRMRDAVGTFLKVNNLPYHKIIFACGKKLDISVSEQFDVHIDDCPKDILSISKHIPVVKFEATYNKNIVSENVFTAKTWEDVYDIIMNLKRK